MNCMIIDDEEMSRLTLRMLIEKTEFLTLTHEFDNPTSAIPYLSEVDLLFLDVEMPEMSGLDLLKNIDVAPTIILTTAKTQYALEAFEYDVTDYLVKPIQYVRFVKAVNKAYELHKQNMQGQPYGDSIFVRTEAKIIKISLNKILYIEALADYVTLHLADEKHVVHGTMKALEKKLPPHDFMRVHRSFIVNVNNISAIEDLNIMINKRVIPIGASYKDSFLKRIMFL
jgi:DNA-binding LytR/AlgR family response regulator